MGLEEKPTPLRLTKNHQQNGSSVALIRFNGVYKSSKKSQFTAPSSQKSRFTAAADNTLKMFQKLWAKMRRF